MKGTFFEPRDTEYYHFSSLRRIRNLITDYVYRHIVMIVLCFLIIQSDSRCLRYDDLRILPGDSESDDSSAVDGVPTDGNAL